MTFTRLCIFLNCAARCAGGFCRYSDSTSNWSMKLKKECSALSLMEAYCSE